MVDIANGMPSKEAALITARDIGTSDGIGGAVVNAQKLWPLSQPEWSGIGNSTVHSFGNSFWLRSPRSNNSAYFGSPAGAGLIPALVNNDGGAARPAFNLDLTSVLFTSAAAGGKSKPATVGIGLSSAEPTPGAIKFTFLDTSMTLDVTATTAQLTQSSGTLTLGYRGATTGQKQWVSCVLKNGSDVKYYGKLADATSAASGTLSIPFAGVPDDTYTLEIFSEQDNGDNISDFAGNSVALTVNVSDGNVTITSPGTLTHQLSGDAGLTSVAGQTITATGTGISGSPKTASINVANGVSSIAATDIVTSVPNATATLYSDEFTTTAQSVNLNVGANDVYIKVTAEDETELFYKVTAIRAAATAITGLPNSYTLYTGGRASWTPQPTGGTWSYDDDYLSMTKSGDKYTFKALKEEKTTATYTVNGVSHTVNITIDKSELPQTGDSGHLWLWGVLALMSAGGAGALILLRKKREHETQA